MVTASLMLRTYVVKVLVWFLLYRSVTDTTMSQASRSMETYNKNL